MLLCVFSNGDTANLQFCWLHLLAFGMLASLSESLSPELDGKQSELSPVLSQCSAPTNKDDIGDEGHKLFLGMRMGRSQTTHFFT